MIALTSAAKVVLGLLLLYSLYALYHAIFRNKDDDETKEVRIKNVNNALKRRK